MTQLHEYAKIISYLAWMSLFVTVCYHWCRGLIDGKSMVKGCAIIFSIGIGYVLIGYFINERSSLDNGNYFKCVNENNAYYSCMGWPIFKDTSSVTIEGSTPILLKMAENITDIINFFYSWVGDYAAVIAVIILYSKFIKSLWTHEIKQIFFAFFGGIIIYISLKYAVYFQTIFMDMSLYLFGFKNHLNNNDNLITSVVSNLQNWNLALRNLQAVQSDMGIFSSTAIRQLPEFIIAYFLRIIVDLPLFWFGLLNLFMMICHHFMLITLPYDAVRMSLNVEVDPLIIIRKLMAMGLLSVAIVVEFQFLDWIPSPPVMTAGALGGVVVAGFTSFFWSGVIILVVLILGTIFSGISVMYAFKSAKSAIVKG